VDQSRLQDVKASEQKEKIDTDRTDHRKANRDDKEMLKREEKDRNDESSDRTDRKKESKWREHSTAKKKLTPEERQKRLQEMQVDAQKHEKDKVEQIKKATEEELREKAELQRRKDGKDRGETTPQFISTMGKDVYTDKGTASLQDRLQRNRFYVQRTHDDH